MGNGGEAWIRGRLLGVGAFGQVNLAMERVTGDLFAVKSTEDCCCSNSSKHKSTRSDGEDQDLGVAAAGNNSLAALENEIQMLQDLESEFVVRCLGSDWSEEGGKRMRNLFLEYMPGGCLSELLKQFFASTGEAGMQQQEQQPLVLDEHLIRSYTKSLVKAIHYLHCRGIVHCDIKGKNVLVGNAGTVKLADFGSAKRISNGPGQSSCCTALPGVLGEQEQLGLQQDAEAAAAGTMENKVNGTPLWMAPEVVLQKEQGFPSDIWSLGCTVVEMATGRAPWAHIADPFVALYRIGCSDEVPQTPASLSPEAQDFLAHCFQRDPRKRWTAAKLLQHPFLTGGTQAPPTCCLDGAAPPPPRRLLQQQLSSCKAAASPPASPTSVLELDHHDSTSTLVLSSSSSSTPLVSTPSTFFWKKLAALESPRRPSQQIEEAGATRSSSGSIIKDWWDSSSPLTPLSQGEWIVVRSPKASPKRLESPPSPPPHRLADAASAQKACKSSPAEEEEEDEEIACRGASSTASSLLPPAAAAVAAPSACTTATASAAKSGTKQNFLQILHKAESVNFCSNKTGAPSSSTFFFGSLLQHHPNLQIPQKNPEWMKKPDSSSGPNSMQDHHQILDQSVIQKIIDSTDWTQWYLSSAIDKSQRRRTRRRRRRRRRRGGGGAPLEAAHQRRCLQQPPRSRSRRRRTHIDKNLSLPCFSEYKQHLDKISQDLSNDRFCIRLQLMSKSDTGSQFIQEKDCLCVCVCVCAYVFCVGVCSSASP